MIKWKCPYCGFEKPLFEGYYWKCPACGKPLVVDYSLTAERVSSRNPWYRFKGYIPFVPEKYRGEGDTPLVSESSGEHELLFKLEYLNPGGSFKDRGSALAIYYAYKMGFRKVVNDTSGNTGISITLYSRLYGISPTIVMPSTAPEGKKKLVRRLGGEVVEVENRDLGGKKALEIAESSGAMYVAHVWNYLYVIGASTIVFEVVEEAGVPDYVIAPVGSGGLLLGLVRGFEILRGIGLISKMPRFYAVQGYSVQPVHEAFKGFTQPGEPSTLADGIMVGNPPRLAEIVNALKKYNGDVVLVGDSEIKRALAALWEWGFIVEPTSAAAFAAYEKVRSSLPRGKVLIVLTGSGLKMV